jgi:hypothetical protein
VEPPAQAPDTDDEVRDRIFRRRALFVAVALGGAAAAYGACEVLRAPVQTSTCLSMTKFEEGPLPRSSK